MTEEELRRLRQEARQEYLALNYPTLRDTFATAALSGLLINRDLSSEQYAVAAYQIADAMLAERQADSNVESDEVL